VNKTLVKFLLIYATIIGNIALFFPFVFSALLATIAIVILLEPLSLRLSKKLKISRPISHAIALIVLFLSLTTILVFLIPPLIKETANFYEMVAKFFEGKEWEKVLSPTLATRISQIVSLLEPKLLRFFESMVSAITKTLPQIFTFLFYVILGSVYLTYYFPSLEKKRPLPLSQKLQKRSNVFPEGRLHSTKAIHLFRNNSSYTSWNPNWIITLDFENKICGPTRLLGNLHQLYSHNRRFP